MTRPTSNSKKAGSLPDAESFAKMQKQMADLAKKNDELQEKVEELESKKPESKDKDEDEDSDEDASVTDDDNDGPVSSIVKKTKDMVREIKDGMRNWQFGKIKFINSPTLAKPHMLSLLNFIKGDKNFANLSNEYKNNWCKVHCEAFCKSLSPHAEIIANRR